MIKEYAWRICSVAIVLVWVVVVCAAVGATWAFIENGGIIW